MVSSGMPHSTLSPLPTWMALTVPATSAWTGVMSFMVNHEGKVYEKDLGSKTASVATSMTRFNPDAGWKPVEVPLTS